ncbi:MAG: Mur ligase family protein, partial [Firmicutes bacterium]|nr:Mur ligase family protein [Bacillota bacterium]
YLYFYKNSCDIALIETGLGGKFDATNAVKKPVLEIITSVDFDHMQHLGDTLREISSNKAGIIKPDTTVVSIKQNEKVNIEIKNACELNNCRLILADERRIADIKFSLKETAFRYHTAGGSLLKTKIRLLGAYQPANAIVAVEALQVLKRYFDIKDNQIISGLKSAKWFGRFTVICKNPLFILDGAHNLSAAIKLKKSVELYFKDKNITFIFGVFSDKDYKGIIAKIANLAKKIIAIDAPSKRALSQSMILDEIKKYNKCAHASKNIEDAIEQSLENVNSNDVIIAFGSLSFLAEIKKKFRGIYAGFREN